jgi:tetratricopeptide (TPR) repeat protein
MNKNIFILIFFLIFKNIFASELNLDYETYKSGMELFGQNKYIDAQPMLLKIINSQTITDDQKVYAAIALSQIDVTPIGPNKKEKLDDSVVVLQNVRKNTKPSKEAKRDLLLVLAKTYRYHDVGKIVSSYKISSDLLKEFPGDESVLFNYSVASLFMAGHSREKDENQKIIDNYFEDAIKYSKIIIAKNDDKSFVGAAFNIIGLTYDRQNKYEDAAEAFQSAISSYDKPVYHRNLGWALFGGVSKKMKGRERLSVLQKAYDEFQKAIKNGDDDPATKKQLDNMLKEIERLSIS